MGLIKTSILTFVLAWSCTQCWADESQPSNPQVLIATDMGDIVIELYPQQAPISVENFLNYTREYHYHGTLFHRVIKGFMIQAGGYGFDLFPREAGDPIVNESSNGLKNKRGTVAMARQADPDSARAQFFINLSDNKHLNSKGENLGYTVFGKVISGMGVVDKISKVRTRRVKHIKNVPVTPISILRAEIITPKQGQTP